MSSWNSPSRETTAGPVTALRSVELALGLLMVGCLITLAIRAAVRLEDRWDTFMYHLPFAAIRGGLDIPYEMNEKMVALFQGFPPLADLVQGLLWRATGSVNATGVVNYLAFLSFVAVCQRKLGAPFYLVAAIALTAPLVLIHTTVSYVDLFGNSWLALALVCLFFAYYFDRTDDRWVLRAGLLGLAAAAWTKFQLVPVVALSIPMYLMVYRPHDFRRDSAQRHVLYWILGAVLLAAAPYVKNWVEFGNPFWPIQIPWVGAELDLPHNHSFELDSTPQVPPPYLEDSRSMLFIRSLFEIVHPHEYANRPRWIIDQGNAWIAFRSGGFWNVSVIVYLMMTALLLLSMRPKKGIMVILAGLLMLAFVSNLPQSHQLRYYMFIPIVWAGIIGTLYARLRKRRPLLGIGVLITVLSLFTYVSWLNLSYYKIERIGYTEIARKRQADLWWPHLQADVKYCAVGVLPFGMMLTGPTLSEYYIIDRSREILCPEDTVHIGYVAGLDKMMGNAIDLIYRKGEDIQAVAQLNQVLQIAPTHYGALWQRAVALERSGQTEEAIEAWEKVVGAAMANEYGNLAEANRRLASLKTPE